MPLVALPNIGEEREFAMKQANDCKIRSLGAFWFAIAAIVLISLFGITHAEAATRIDESQAIVGEDGKVYGIPHTNAYDEFVMPDMVKVRATNGTYGYIDNVAQAFAVLGYPDSQEEMMEAIDDNTELKANALREAFFECYGVDLLNSGDAHEIVSIAAKQNGRENARVALVESTNAGLLEALQAGRIESTKAASLIVHSLQNADQVEASPIADERVAKLDAAEEFLANQGAASLGKEDIEIDAEAFSDLYRIAQEKTAVAVPVYAIDGETVVGEYMINMM